MSANVETMFSVREKPWHGLGTIVAEAPESETALRMAGLDWKVEQTPIYTPHGKVEGYKANVRSTDGQVLGVVTDRYKVIQNTEAFAFTDELLCSGVRYETAGSLQGGKKIWLLARMPREFIIAGERISPYLVFSNTHDGSGAVRVAVTPIRVVCNNTLNLALNTAARSFSMVHTGDIRGKVNEAKQTLFMVDQYMENLGREFERLRRQKLSDQQVKEYIELLLPVEKGASPMAAKNVQKLRSDLAARYYDAPDLKNVGNNAYRFINAVSDFATHADPIRRTKNYQENLFMRTYEGNPMIDKAYQLVAA
jgi:phage/plasmid-like protein (TIGR03299 family)